MKREPRVRFYSSPLFVERRLTWCGLVTRPHPTLIELAPNIYFGHPETIARFKAEIEAKKLARP